MKQFFVFLSMIFGIGALFMLVQLIANHPKIGGLFFIAIVFLLLWGAAGEIAR